MPIPAILAPLAIGMVSSLAQKAFGSTSETTTAPQTLGKDDFMKLMLAQLQNQDPLNPMDNAAFATQTAQFTSLEQLQSINKTLQGLASQSGNGGVATASALLGKTVTVNGSPLVLDGSNPAALVYGLSGSASAVVVRVQDAAGNVVRTITTGPQGQGAHQLSFDGLAEDGRKLSAGAYTYQVGAADSAGNLIPGVYTGAGSVTGVGMQGGTLMLQVGNQIVPLSSVVGVMGGSVVSSQ
jgi:flagellar basal-body rod modification protein FlgD